MRKSASIVEIAKAMNAVHAAIEPAVKDGFNPHFKSKYAGLSSVWDAIRDPIVKNGLSVIQGPEGSGPEITVVTLVMHTPSGEWVEVDTTLQVGGLTPHQAGSAISYAQRYALRAIFGVCSQDDDGNEASINIKGEGKRSETVPVPQKDMGEFSDFVIDVRQRKAGTGKLFLVETAEHGELQTWKEEIAVLARDAKGADFRMVFDSEPTKYGPSIRSLRKE